MFKPKLVINNDGKALGKQLAKSDHSISNGAVAKIIEPNASKAEKDKRVYGDLVSSDYQEGICGHIEFTATPLVIAAENIELIAQRALRIDVTFDMQASALRAIREIAKESLNQYSKLLEMKRTDHEG